MTTKTTGATGAPKIRRSHIALGISFGALMVATGAFAQDAGPAPTSSGKPDSDVVVITGFRGSLQTAISAKKREDTMVDVIKSEDIGQFPDLNLAESLQRIPGVAIDRDGGEGRSITVRGLNSDFTRVRLNGLEALATTGGKDSSGGANRGRGFDFNVFAADLFNSVTVRKSMAAETEEGSLGATVDLQTARPFDYKGFTMAMGGEVGYNDLSKDSSPRGQFLISNRWADGKLGALLSVAYGTRQAWEEGPNTTRWENAYATSNVGRFAGYYDASNVYHPIAPCTGSNAACNTSEVNAQNPTLTGDALAISRAEHPRIPRYSRFITDQKRLGITGSFQMRPNPDTLVTLDGMYAEYSANRDEYEVEAISFSRNGQGLPKTVLRSYSIDDQGTLVKGVFDNVDVRAEHRYDELKTTFKQLNLTWDQNIGDKLTMKALIGASDSFQDNPEQTTFTLDAYDVQGYSYDYTDSRKPVFNYGTSNGCTQDQTCYWSYTPSTANPATAAAAKGDASLIRIRPQYVENKFGTAKVDFKYTLNSALDFKVGASAKAYDFASVENGRFTADPNTRDEAASTTYSSGLNSALSGNLAKYTQTVSVMGNTFLIPNLDAIRSDFGYDCNCTNAFGKFTVNATNSSSRVNNREAHERDSTTYAQVDFHTDLLNMPVRGNLGVRQVETKETVSGYIGKSSASVFTTIDRSYKDTLPAFNISVQPLHDVYIRFAAAKTMSRPTLQSLAPGGSITLTGSAAPSIGTTSAPLGNPYLEPIRANTLDLSFEWYPDRESLASLAFFQKDIKTYIQTTVEYVPFKELGYDPALLAGSTYTVDTPFAITQSQNTPGGTLKGYEFNLQKPFTFLPGILKRFGGIINYTHVESKIQYIVSSSVTPAGVTSYTYRTADLLGLSPESWNATLYYEDDRLSGRVAVSHRAGYLSLLNPGSSADFQGKNETTNVDLQVTYKLNRNFTLILEGINLTDQYDDRYDSYNTAQGNTGQNLLLDYSHPGRQYYAGFRYKY